MIRDGNDGDNGRITRTVTHEAPMDEITHAEQPCLDPLLEERLLDLVALVTLLQEQLTQVHTTCGAVRAAVERCTVHQAEQAVAWHQLQAQLDRLQASGQTLTQPTHSADRFGWRWLPGRRRRREA